MLELALHVLDVLQNAIEAGARRVSLTIQEDRASDLLSIEVSDDGRGMDAGTAARVVNPFYTTRTTRHVGLGLPLLARAAEQAGGGLAVASRPGHGTTIRATFQLSHPDRQPLGDLSATLIAFLLGAGTVELKYTHRVILPGPGGGGAAGGFEFDTADIRAMLGELPLDHPSVTRWLTEYLQEGEDSLAEIYHAKA